MRKYIQGIKKLGFGGLVLDGVDEPWKLSTDHCEPSCSTLNKVARWSMVSALDQRPWGRGFESAGCGLSCSNRGPVALCTWAWAYSTLHPLWVSKWVPAIAGKLHVQGRYVRRCLVRAMYLSASGVSYLGRYIKCSTFTFFEQVKRADRRCDKNCTLTTASLGLGWGRLLEFTIWLRWHITPTMVALIVTAAMCRPRRKLTKYPWNFFSGYEKDSELVLWKAHIGLPINHQ